MSEPSPAPSSARARRIRIAGEALGEMLRHARRHVEEECCGLLAGSGDVITHVFPAKNILRSGTAYEIAPAELFEIFRAMRRAGLDHLGIYHSHPATENAPSPRDIDRAYYPDAAYFILSPLASVERPVRAFSIRDGAAAELEIESL